MLLTLELWGAWGSSLQRRCRAMKGLGGPQQCKDQILNLGDCKCPCGLVILASGTGVAKRERSTAAGVRLTALPLASLWHHASWASLFSSVRWGYYNLFANSYNPTWCGCPSAVGWIWKLETQWTEGKGNIYKDQSLSKWFLNVLKNHDNFRNIFIFPVLQCGFSFCLSLHLEVKVKSLSHVRLFEIPWTVAYQASPSMGFSRQEYWSGLPFPSSKLSPTHK